MDHNQNNGNARQRIVRTEEQILAILEEYDNSGFTAKIFLSFVKLMMPLFIHGLGNIDQNQKKTNRRVLRKWK